MPAPLSKPPPDSLHNPLAALVGIPYIPPAQCFVVASADIYAGNGSIPVPGPLRTTGVPCLVTGSWMAGHRQAVHASDAYTHIMLVDPGVEIRDPYTGNGQALGAAPDAVQCTGETLSNVTSPWRFVVFSFIADIPGLGRRKVVFLDQRNTYPATTILKDTFTDANTALLTAHVMDAGSGWTMAAGVAQINASGQAIIQPGSMADARARSQSGQANFIGGSLDVVAVGADPAIAGFVLRSTGASNQYEVRLCTTYLKIVK